MIYKYYTIGTEQDKEGVTLATAVYDDEGTFIAGIQDIEINLYRATEVTQEVYESYLERMEDPDQRGLYGVVDATGKAAYDAYVQEKQEGSIVDPSLPVSDYTSDQLNAIVAFIQHLIDASVIAQTDVAAFLVLFDLPSNRETQILNEFNSTP